MTVLDRYNNGEEITIEEAIREIVSLTPEKPKPVLFENGKVCRCPVKVGDKVYSSWFQHTVKEDGDLPFDRACKADTIFEAYTTAKQQNQVKGGAWVSLFDGVTTCVLEDQDRNVVSRGYSFIAGDDQFKTKTARNKSRGKAVQNLIHNPTGNKK
jgi:hypothetical protein